jgi:hypothetical protein
LLVKLKNNGIYCISPEGGIIGSYASDPDCAVLTVSSLNEAGTGFDQLSGGGFGGQIVGPGGVMHQLISSGVITTGGVSATNAIIAACVATVCEYGKKGDVASAVDAILATAIPFTDSTSGLSGKRIDLFAALQYDSDAPSVTEVDFGLADPNRMVVKGHNFGANPQVIINGQDVSRFVKNLGNTKKLKLKGDISSLVHVGSNTIQVNGSSLFVFTV